jgi:hypothetical protein
MWLAIVHLIGPGASTLIPDSVKTTPVVQVGVPKITILYSGCGQTPCLELHSGRAIVHGRLLRACMSCLEVKKVAKMGKTAQKKGRN